jgi:hypothetical protein
MGEKLTTLKKQFQSHILTFLVSVSHHFQTEGSRRSGVSCMIPVETLKEESSGFIVGDSCVFGVELISLATAKANHSSETVHVQKTNGFSAREAYTWVIDDFLALKGRCYSPEFEIGGRIWYLQAHTCMLLNITSIYPVIKPKMQVSSS